MAIAFIEPEPIVYEQAGQCYYVEVVTPEVITMVEIETATSSEVVVSVICTDYRDYGCSCMVHIRNMGIVVSGYDAKDLVPNYFGSPFKGDVANFHYPTIAHAGYVMEVYLKSFLISECNYTPATCGTRIIQKDDPNLIGFIHRPIDPQSPI